MREKEYLSEKGGKGKRDEEKDGDGRRRKESGRDERLVCNAILLNFPEHIIRQGKAYKL